MFRLAAVADYDPLLYSGQKDDSLMQERLRKAGVDLKKCTALISPLEGEKTSQEGLVKEGDEKVR